jgi:hypothetical protein
VGEITCQYTVDEKPYTDSIFIIVEPDTEGPNVDLVSCDPDPAKIGSEVTITLYFWDDVSGVNLDVEPIVKLILPEDDPEDAIDVTSSEGLLSDGFWTGTVTIPEGAHQGESTITVTGACDIMFNEMEPAELDGPFIDTTPPDDPEVTPPEPDPPGPPGPDGVGYYVSPAYVKGVKPADAVDVLWRYAATQQAPEHEWHSVRDVMEHGGQDGKGGDSVVADTWWWTEIPLHPCCGTSNVTDVQRVIHVEFAAVDEAGNMSVPHEETLKWLLTRIGSGNHLIQREERMLLAGPATAGSLPEGPKTLTITGPDITGTLQAAFVACSEYSTNWVVEFPTEGPDRLYTAKISLDADPNTFTTSTSLIHVIKKLHAEVKLAVTAKPPDFSSDPCGWAMAWLRILCDLADVQLPWVTVVAEDSQYAVVQVPRADSKSSWADYAVKDGEEFPWIVCCALRTVLNRDDLADLWWSKQLESGDNEICLEVSYRDTENQLCKLAHDSPAVSTTWLEDDVIGAFVAKYRDDTQAVFALVKILEGYGLVHGLTLSPLNSWWVDHEHHLIVITPRSNASAADKLYQVLASSEFYQITGLPETWQGATRRIAGGVIKGISGAIAVGGGILLWATPDPSVLTKIGGSGACVFGLNAFTEGATQTWRRQGGINVAGKVADSYQEWLAGDVPGEWWLQSRTFVGFSEVCFDAASVGAYSKFLRTTPLRKLPSKTASAIRAAYWGRAPGMYAGCVRGLRKQLLALRAEGKSWEETARAVHAMRRKLVTEFRAFTPKEYVDIIKARNLEKYGDELGPTIEWLRGQGKSWEEIAEWACTPGAEDITLLHGIPPPPLPPPPPGTWDFVTRSMPDESAIYQSQITGQPAEKVGERLYRMREYQANRIWYDGRNTEALLEAKANYRWALDTNGEFMDWFGANELEEVRRQLNAACGAKLEWHIAQSDVKSAYDILLDDYVKKYPNLEIIWTPPLRQ